MPTGIQWSKVVSVAPSGATLTGMRELLTRLRDQHRVDLVLISDDPETCGLGAAALRTVDPAFLLQQVHGLAHRHARHLELLFELVERRDLLAGTPLPVLDPAAQLEPASGEGLEPDTIWGNRHSCLRIFSRSVVPDDHPVCLDLGCKLTSQMVSKAAHSLPAQRDTLAH